MAQNVLVQTVIS